MHQKLLKEVKARRLGRSNGYERQQQLSNSPQDFALGQTILSSQGARIGLMMRQ
jgi:hypothetical protein